jgi:glycosyltransferase involved in cell wall biosynthesis
MPAQDARQPVVEAPLLTIGIPTRNRLAYLRDLVLALEAQIRADDLSSQMVEVLVSDNASQDQTRAFVEEVAARLPNLKYSRNSENLGALGNYHKLVRDARGRFIWIIGDDDLILPGALVDTLELLRADPGLGMLIHFDTRYDSKLRRPLRFASYRDYIRECARVNPHALVEHTLTSSNVYRADAFDRAFAQEKDATDFAHMYGMGRGLKLRGGAIHVSSFPAIRVRDRRAPAVDGVWPTDLERSWLNYLGWLKESFDVPELRPQSAIDHIRHDLIRKITSHPVRYIRDNLLALRQPQAWWWFLKRLLFHGRRKWWSDA